MTDARTLKTNTPESMIMNDFLKPAKISQSELEGNQYFAERWWEVDQWEYREDIMVCLISAEDALGMDKSKRVFVDIRSF